MTAPLPEGSLLLHIGPQKTGSTAIQMAMHDARAELAAQGVLYPGDRQLPREAGWAVLGSAPIGRPDPRPRLWDELVAELNANTLPRACLSNEDFGTANGAAIERIMAGVGTENTHLVFVARRLDKLMPSHWQERVKARQTYSYEEFLHHVLDTPDIDWEARFTWEPHDVQRFLAGWTKYLPRERITVIVSDESDKSVIPNAFEDLLGLRRGTLKPPPSRSNASLSFTQTEALRRLNVLSRDQKWTPEQYWRIVQAGALKVLRTSQVGLGKNIAGLPEWAFSLVADRAEAQVSAIRSSGVNVIGDPERLLVRGNAEPAPLPPTVEVIPLDLLAEIVMGALEGAASLHRRELKAELRRARREARASATPSAREALGVLAQRARRLGRG